MSSDHEYSGSVAAIHVFLAELGLSPILLLVSLATVFYSSTIHRSAASMNIYITFLIYTFSYLILPITGQWNVPEPPFSICLLSATLGYASFPLCSAAVLALSMSVLMSVFHHGSSHPIFRSCLIAIPYMVWFGVIVEGFVVGLTSRSDVVRHGYPYCIMKNPVPGQTSRALLAICLIPSVILQIITLHRLFFVADPFSGNPALQNAMRKRVIRISIFSIGSVGAVALSLSFSVMTHGSTVQLIIQGVFPLWSVVVFGTQREMFDSWIRWFRRTTSSSEMESKTNLGLNALEPSLKQV